MGKQMKFLIVIFILSFFYVIACSGDFDNAGYSDTDGDSAGDSAGDADSDSVGDTDGDTDSDTNTDIDTDTSKTAEESTAAETTVTESTATKSTDIQAQPAEAEAVTNPYEAKTDETLTDEEMAYLGMNLEALLDVTVVSASKKFSDTNTVTDSGLDGDSDVDGLDADRKI